MPATFSRGGQSEFHRWESLGSSPDAAWPFSRVSFSGLGFPQRSSAAAWVWRRRAREKLSSRGQAAHEFLFAGQQVAQPRAGGVGLDAALHFGKFLLGLTLLERFDAA